jgi:hypothetical protein
MKPRTTLLAALLAATTAWAAPSRTLPSFEATALTGQSVSAQQLLGQPSVLIVTPSRDAAPDTRAWAEALRKNLDAQSIRIRDVLAIDLPFFMSESDAIGRAKEKIPARYHDQTWLLGEQNLEKALDIPSGSGSAYVFVLDAQGHVVTRVEGRPTDQRVRAVESAVDKLK